ncbi:MAG TPA: PAS domain S-box protein, partial [Elusimicrobiota bacterium]|nr:PAS domain S-box protein [Elusimicrobiota bacterium]
GLWDAKITPGTLWYDPDAPVYYSPRFKQLLGYDDHEMPNILGSWDSKLHPDDRDRVFDSVRRHLENRVPYDTEYRLQTKSGDYRWFNARGQAVWDEFGMPIRMSGSLRDITPQRHAQEALRWRDRAIAASSCSIIMTDARVPHNPIVYVNPAFERMFGYTAAEAVGQNPRFLQQTDRDQPALIGLREAIAAARPHQTVLRNYRKDHRVIINEVFVAPVHDEHGRLTHFIGIQNDITDRVAAESELQQRESRFRSLIENISDMIIIVDKGGLVQYASPSIERILGYAPADLIGQSVFKGISPNERPALILAAEDLMHRSGALLTRELRYRHREGGWRILEIVAQNHLERPAVNGVIVNARDVTERKKLESIVFQSEKMSAVGQLAAGIAHELNNPLHTILGFADGLAEQTPEDGHFKVPLQFIRHETIRCRSLVQRLLTFSRQPTPGVEMEDVQELVEEVLALIEAQAKIKNVRLERSYADPLPAVSLQRGQIQQMLLNICNNALDAMPDGGLLKVALDVGHNPFGGASDFLRITIADSGPGIPAKIRSRIFEPFFTTKPAGEGTGLGLSLAYEIAKAHHGDIAVSSESGHGTIFEVYLPLLPASERIAV